MKKYLFKLLCTDGGWGWGQTNQKSEMVVQEETFDKAEKFLKSFIPGGWTYEYVGLTNRREGLQHESMQLLDFGKQWI